jgi:hypothetical protein
MNIWSLAREYENTRVLVVESSTILQCLHDAVRFYSAYGDIRSLSKSDSLPGAPASSDLLQPAPSVAYPAPALVIPAVSEAASLFIQLTASASQSVAPIPTSLDLPIKSLDHITDDTELTPGEWAIIRPLFILYVEKEVATHLEGSRGLGVDVFGRSVAEVQGDIERMHDELPGKAFVTPMIEI